jgi:hypothetical protein
MKAAILINGQPRFTREFDDLLTNLTAYDQLDFFFYIWKQTHTEHSLIAPQWPNKPVDIQEIIERNLPDNARLVVLQVEPLPGYTTPEWIQLNPWTNPYNVWYNYYSLKQVNLLREQFEKINGKYDMVIRARADVGVRAPVNLKQFDNYLKSNPKHIIVPDNHRNGGYSVNDMIAFGTSDTMSIYARAMDSFETFHKQGVMYHAETLLGKHLQVNGVSWPSFGIDQVKNEHQNPQRIPNPDTVDYGRWI